MKDLPSQEEAAMSYLTQMMKIKEKNKHWITVFQILKTNQWISEGLSKNQARAKWSDYIES